MSDEVKRAQVKLETAIADFGVASSYGPDLPRIARAAKAVTQAIDALVLAARRDGWATRKGPALLAVVEAAERMAAARKAWNSAPHGTAAEGAADQAQDYACHAVLDALASLTRNDEVSR